MVPFYTFSFYSLKGDLLELPSVKRNADFKELFPTLDADERLVEGIVPQDYSYFLFRYVPPRFTLTFSFRLYLCMAHRHDSSRKNVHYPKPRLLSYQSHLDLYGHYTLC